MYIVRYAPARVKSGISDPLAVYCMDDKVLRAFKSPLTKKGKDVYTVSVKYTRVYNHVLAMERRPMRKPRPNPGSKPEMLPQEDFPMEKQNSESGDCAGKVKEKRAWKREMWCWCTEARPRR